VSYRLCDFLYETQKKAKKHVKKKSFQAGMTWRFERILDHHTSHRLCGKNRLNTWRACVSCDDHSPVQKIKTGVFTVLLPNILTAPFHSFRMRSRWYDFFLLHPFFYLLFFINIFNWKYFYLTGYGSWTRAKPDWAFCWSACAGWWSPKKGATVRG
jgi:hypothetical protein